jgi:hypothetical protein
MSNTGATIELTSRISEENNDTCEPNCAPHTGELGLDEALQLNDMCEPGCAPHTGLRAR